MKRLIPAALLTLALSPLPSFAADVLHDYCSRVAYMASNVVLAHDYGVEEYVLNRDNLKAQNVSARDISMVITGVYHTDLVTGLSPSVVAAGTYDWCLKAHAGDAWAARSPVLPPGARSNVSVGSSVRITKP